MYVVWVQRALNKGVLHNAVLSQTAVIGMTSLPAYKGLPQLDLLTSDVPSLGGGSGRGHRTSLSIQPLLPASCVQFRPNCTWLPGLKEYESVKD